MDETGHPAVRVARSLLRRWPWPRRSRPRPGTREFFVIGGESVYRDALPLADRVYLTRVHGEVTGDRAMPDGWLAGFELAGRDDEAGAQGPLRVLVPRLPAGGAVSLYCFENVRTPEQRAEMARLDAAGICLFCPEHLASHPQQRILLSTEHWSVTPNEFPYQGTSLHLLACAAPARRRPAGTQ